jgi:hypothetical protein
MHRPTVALILSQLLLLDASGIAFEKDAAPSDQIVRVRLAETTN